MTISRPFFDPDYLCHEQLKTYKHKKREYFNVSSSFDIEDTSFYHEDGYKCACMYAFVFGLNGKVIFGRTWNDLFAICEALKKAYDLDENRILPVYVHNFSHEFGFIARRFKWLDIFATAERKPIRALTEYGIEFRDSYILSGQGLAGTAKNLTRYKIEKLSGDLDYRLLRHSTTKLTPKEWHYIENDGLSLMAFIQEEIENNGNINRVPMTKTGYVRKYMRSECYHGGQKGHGERRKVKTRDYGFYKNLMERLKLTLPEYILATEAFAGGFTHANNFNVGLIFNNVASEDLTSAYPATLVLDRYPMGPGTLYKGHDKAEILEIIRNYACLFRVKIWGLSSLFRGDNFLSFSKCRHVKGESLDNGRLMHADYLETTLTDIDLDIMRGAYSMEKIEIFDLWYYPRGYLPRNFIKGVLKLYADKTSLKGVEGEEANYQIKKGMLNANYGMMVTSIEQPTNKFDGEEWTQEIPGLSKALEQYNDSPNRFLFYLWGIFCTAHVRHIIARTIIKELGDDYLYADTDSVKFLNFEKHKAYFEQYNREIDAKIKRSAEFNKLPIELYKPKTKEGKEKPIGYFDNEGGEDGICYKRFKTLGAKRYFVEYPEPHKMHTKDGREIETPFNLTVSGVNKTAAIPALIEKAKNEKRDIFDYFEIGFEFTGEMSGKLLHTYCDYEIKGTLIDYQGKRGRYHELTFVHLEPTTYKITTTEEYLEQLYLDQLERVERRKVIRI